ncbi:MAG: hypothetical protein ACI8QH_001436 [Flammeovirgaceae bacterium]|jgi:hypothetical protein
MEAFIRRPTKSTPYVHLDNREGTYLLAGRSIPIDAEQFFHPILNWIDRLSEEPVSVIDFRFRLDFFNIASSKRILFILYKLADLQKKGVKVNIRWMYERFDDDMLEIGQDYSVMIDGPNFFFEEYDLVERQEQVFAKQG